MANTPTKGYNKYFELNAREHTIYVLAKEYKKTENGDTLCALTYALKGCKNNFEVFEKMVSYLNNAGLIGKICEFAGNCGEKLFAIQIKDKLADIKLAEFYAQREKEL